MGTNRTSRDLRSLVAIRGKADMARQARFGRDGPKPDMSDGTTKT